ncbi:MAG: four helix bundle protein [Candidatus Moraniibacteriota bacterium]|nr:MAG: four helix bundle protein [Candidatus Moranbacteria bacterium]
MDKNFQEILKEKGDAYASGVYRLSRSFPKDELYGLTSQLRRSALSVVLNCIEGYARASDGQYRNFLHIAYGSLKESEYLLGFAKRENYVDNEAVYEELLGLADEIGAILWKTIDGLKDRQGQS